MPDPAIVRITRGARLRIEVCPNPLGEGASAVCACPRFAGNLPDLVAPVAPKHTVQEFSALPHRLWPNSAEPWEHEGMTEEERRMAMDAWMRQCRDQVRAALAPPAVPVPDEVLSL